MINVSCCYHSQLGDQQMENSHSITASVYFPFMGLWRSCGDKENVSREFSMSSSQAATYSRMTGSKAPLPATNAGSG